MYDPTDRSDFELFHLWCNAGHRHAGDELLRRHEVPLMMWLEYHNDGDLELAADLAQDTWLAAQTSGNYSGKGTFLSWLKSIAARLR